AAADDGAIADVQLDTAQEFPAAGSDVALLHGAAVDRHAGDADLEGRIEYGEEIPLAVIGIVHAAAHLEGDGHAVADGVEKSTDDTDGRFGLREQESAATAAQHFLDGATEVDVDDIESALDQFDRGQRELLGLGAHELPADGMLVGRDVEV